MQSGRISHSSCEAQPDVSATHSRSILLPFLILLIYLGTLLLQSQFLIHQDVASFSYWADRLLAGGTYSNDFFETNPPLIILLSIPPALIAKLFSISLTTTTRVYTGMLISLSLLLCYHLSQSVFSAKDNALRSAFIFLLALVMLIMPSIHFGQREHLLLAFTVPYILMLTLRLENKPIHRPLAAVIGTLAGIGFCFKPFFMVVPCLLLSYQLTRQKKLTALFTPENVSLAAFTMLYSVVTVYFFPDYFSTITPYLLKYYYQGIANSLTYLALVPPILLTYLSLAYFLLFRDQLYLKTLSTLLAITLIGFYLAYLLNHSAWLYHMLPSYCLATFFFLFLQAQQIMQGATSAPNKAYQAAFTLLMITFLIFSLKYFWNDAAILQSSLAILILVYFFTAITTGKLSSSGKWHTNLRELPSFILILLFLSIPLLLSYGLFTQGTFYRTSNQRMVTLLEHYSKHQPVYYFSTSSRFTHPALDMAKATPASRFPFLWMLPGLLHQLKLNPDDTQANNDLNNILDMIAADILHTKPELILIDISPKKEGLVNNPTDFLKLIENHSRLRKELDRYQPLTTIVLPLLTPDHSKMTYQVLQKKTPHRTNLKDTIE